MNYSNNDSLIYPQDLTYYYQPLTKIFGEENFATIEKITPELLQLHIYGEIFSENGYFIRSDKRMKQKIQEIKNSLEKVLNIFPYEFQYKNDSKIRSGFIAQQLQEIIPEIVKKDKEGKLSIDILSLIPIIIESLKSIKNILNEMKNKNENKIKEMNSILNETINIIQKLNEQKFEFNFTLGPIYITLPLIIIFIVLLFITILFFPDLPFIFISLLICSILLIFSISKMPKHLKQINSQTFKKIMKSTENMTIKIKKKLTKKTMKEMKKKIIHWLDEKTISNYHKSICISYFIFLNIILSSIALNFIFGETLIRFFGIYIGIILLFWGYSLKYGYSLSFLNLFFILTLIFIIGLLFCFVLIKIQPSLHCELYQYGKNNTIILNEMNELNFLLINSIPWNCIGPKLITKPYISSIYSKPSFDSLLLYTNSSSLSINSSFNIYLQCSTCVEFDCGSFMFI